MRVGPADTHSVPNLMIPIHRRDIESMAMVTDPAEGVRPLADIRAIARAKLQNEGFAKRMKAALCPGLYEPKGISKEESRNVLANCLALCDGNRDILSAVLQEKFIAQHSPFYWAANGAEVGNYRRSQDRYPLLFKFFEATTGELSADTQEDILQALYRTERDALYRDIQAMIPSISPPYSDISSIPDSTIAIAVQNLSSKPYAQCCRIDFRITKFFDRLLVDSEITFRSFLANGSLWTLRAVSEVEPQSQGPQSWHLELTEFRCSQLEVTYNLLLIIAYGGTVYSKARTVQLQINPADESREVAFVDEFFRRNTALPHTMRLNIRNKELATFYENPYIGTDRSLSGTIFIALENQFRQRRPNQYQYW